MRIVILGLTITSSWGNGHATTFRALVRGLSALGHEVLFLERDKPWYRAHRDAAAPPGATTVLYDGIEALETTWRGAIATADAVVVGSYVPDGIAVGERVMAIAGGPVLFYDIDTAVTLARLAEGSCDYLSPGLLRRYHAYLSFTGGPVLEVLERQWGARHAAPLYCCVDPDLYSPEPGRVPTHALGYLGTYSDDRQPTLERLLIATARAMPEARFAVAGPQYPARIAWPANVERTEHLPPAEHRGFYASQRWTLNVTRADMVRVGYSPSVRLFEAACCATPILSDRWEGIETVLEPGEEILLVGDTADVLRALREVPEARRRAIGEAARARVLASHTHRHRAAELVALAHEARQAAA